MEKFISKQIEIEAAQFDGTNLLEGMDFDLGGAFVITIHYQKTYVSPLDFVIKEPDGLHYYPCKPDIFKNKYEPVSNIQIMQLDKVEKEEFLKGVLSTLNCLHWKIPKGFSSLEGYGSDVITSAGFKKAVRWNEQKLEYEAIDI